MRLPRDLDKDGRWNVTEAAELVGVDVGHFRRLVRRGVFPAAHRTSTGLPFYDFELLTRIAEVRTKRVGANGTEVMFYKPRKPKEPQQPKPRKRPQAGEQPSAGSYIATVVEGCRQVGVPDELLDSNRVRAILAAEFGANPPDLGEVIPVVARRLLSGK